MPENDLIKYKYQILLDFYPSGIRTGGFNFCQSNILTLYSYFYSLLLKCFSLLLIESRRRSVTYRGWMVFRASSARQDIVKILTFKNCVWLSDIDSQKNDQIAFHSTDNEMQASSLVPAEEL